MDPLVVVLRLLHIVSGVLWVGFACFTAFYLLPAINDVGPDGGKVMAALQRRGLVTILPILALGTLLPGLWLYWRVSEGLNSQFMGSRFGMALGAGAAIAIVAYVIGMLVTRPAILRAAAIMQNIASAPDEQTRQVQVQEAARMRARAGVGGRVVAWMLIVATGAMAVARYL
jgi:uncharacterized membrane protein YjgN (DUF898 family)